MPAANPRNRAWIDAVLLAVAAVAIWGLLRWDLTRAPAWDWTQAPAGYTEWAKWREPVERNAFLRNPAFPITPIAFLMPDGRRGWAVGLNGRIVATEDGGATWRAQASGTQAALYAVSFVADGRRGWTVGGGHDRRD